MRRGEGRGVGVYQIKAIKSLKGQIEVYAWGPNVPFVCIGPFRKIPQTQGGSETR